MAQCTAPVQGHRTSSGAAACPACGGRGYGSYPGYRSYAQYASRPSGGGSGGAVASTRPARVKASWSSASSSVTYTPAEVRALTPVRRAVESRPPQPDLRDVFLCHAWDDRRGVATELHDLLQERGVSVWFSERDIVLGQPFLREIDRGLAKSRAGLVLVTPALLKRVDSRGVSDKELSALLARELLFPVVHGTTYEELRRVSPLLGSRHGLDTTEDSWETVADKIVELVAIEEVPLEV